MDLVTEYPVFYGTYHTVAQCTIPVSLVPPHTNRNHTRDGDENVGEWNRNRQLECYEIEQWTSNYSSFSQ